MQPSSSDRDARPHSSRQSVPVFESFAPSELSFDMAQEYRNSLIAKMDTLAKAAHVAAPDFAHTGLFDAMGEQFRALQRQEKPYRRFMYGIFKSRPLPSEEQHSHRSHQSPNSHRSHPSPHRSHAQSHPQQQQASEDTKTEDVAAALPLPEKTRDPHDNHHHHQQQQQQWQPMNDESSMVHHSDEEKCEILDDDLPHQQQQQPQVSTVAYNEKEAQKIAVLLYSRYPHPINCADLHRLYYDFYQQPLEYYGRDLDSLIQKYAFIQKTENTLAQFFEHSSSPIHVWKLCNVAPFLASFERDTRYELIRDKVHRTMRRFHPECIEDDERNKLFRYFVGVAFECLDVETQKSIASDMFDSVVHNQSTYLFEKGTVAPRMPVHDKCKVYVLSIKHQVLCILGHSTLTVDEFVQEYGRVFGAEFDMSSFDNQSTFHPLIDVNVLQQEHRLRLSQHSRQAHAQWFKWWSNQGFNGQPSVAGSDNNVYDKSNTNGTLSTPLQSPQYSNHDGDDANGAGTQDQNMNGSHDCHVVQQQQHQQQQQQLTPYENEHNMFHADVAEHNIQLPSQSNPQNAQLQNGYNNESAQETQQQQQYVFLSRIPMHIDSVNEVLSAVEEAYGVKFGQNRPVRFNHDKYAPQEEFPHGAQSLYSVPVEKAAMAQDLACTTYLDVTLKGEPFTLFCRHSARHSGSGQHVQSPAQPQSYTRESVEETKLVFISRIPIHVHSVDEVLNAVESAYGVKFARNDHLHLESDPFAPQPGNAIESVPLETTEMAQTLINAKLLRRVMLQGGFFTLFCREFTRNRAKHRNYDNENHVEHTVQQQSQSYPQNAQNGCSNESNGQTSTVHTDNNNNFVQPESQSQSTSYAYKDDDESAVDTLVFLSRISNHVESVEEVLNAVEEAYGVKFGRNQPLSFKTDHFAPEGRQKAIYSVAVKNAKMAYDLVTAKFLYVQMNGQTAELFCKRWENKPKRDAQNGFRGGRKTFQTSFCARSRRDKRY